MLDLEFLVSQLLSCNQADADVYGRQHMKLTHSTVKDNLHTCRRLREHTINTAICVLRSYASNAADPGNRQEDYSGAEFTVVI